MARLTYSQREKLASGSFALPGRRYPIEDASHARNALARVSQHGTPEEKAKVRAAVHRKYPGIGHKEPDADDRGGKSDHDADDESTMGKFVKGLKRKRK